MTYESVKFVLEDLLKDPKKNPIRYVSIKCCNDCDSSFYVRVSDLEPTHDILKINGSEHQKPVYITPEHISYIVDND